MNGRILNIISMWEIVTMEERTLQFNFMRLAHCVVYGTCRDWLSSENTGLRSLWHYSKCGNDKRIPHNAPDLDVFMSSVSYWVIAVSNENRFWCACY